VSSTTTTGSVRPLVVLGAALVAFGHVAAAQQPAGFEVALVGLDGAKEVLGVLPTVFAPRISPDGERVAFELVAPGENRPRLFVAPLTDLDARQPLPQVGGPVNFAAMWTLDGQRLVFLAQGEAPDALYWQSADGAGDAEHLIDARSAESWTPGGERLTFLTLEADDDYGISLLDIESRSESVLIDLPGTAQHSSNVSSDGRWIAYTSNETGRFEVWAAPIQRPAARRQLTHDGGSHPLWSPDGRTIYFDRGNRMYRLGVDVTDDSITAGEPAELPIAGFQQGQYRRQFDLMPDGRAFLVLFPVSSYGQTER
jgi:hypothetical protein